MAKKKDEELWDSSQPLEGSYKTGEPEQLNVPKRLRYKIRNQFNRDEKDIDPEVNKKPSQTIPGQSMEITEVLKRFASGLPINSAKVPVYNGEEFLPDIKNMDLADLQALREATTENVQKIQSELQVKAETEKQKKIQAERDKYRDKLRKEWEEEQSQKSNTITKSIFDKHKD